MDENELADLKHQVESHENDLTAAVKEIERLKKENALILEALKEMPNFVVPPTSFGETRDQNAASRQRFNDLVRRLGQTITPPQS